MLLDTNQLQQAKQLVEEHYGRKIVNTKVIEKTGDNYEYFRPVTSSKVNKAFFGTINFFANSGEEYGDVNSLNAYTMTRNLANSGISFPGQSVVLHNCIFQATYDSGSFDGFSFIGYEFDLQPE